MGNIASAVFSTDGTYRYLLTRTWGPQSPAIWVMLNPSTADETVTDPTITRCVRFSRRWGCGGLVIVNLYGLRSTDPAALATHVDPVGPDNDQVIAASCVQPQPQMVIAAWGAAFRHVDRPREVLRILAETDAPVTCLGVTKDGHPRHPLYVRSDTTPVPYVPDVPAEAAGEIA